MSLRSLRHAAACGLALALAALVAVLCLSSSAEAQFLDQWFGGGGYSGGYSDYGYQPRYRQRRQFRRERAAPGAESRQQQSQRRGQPRRDERAVFNETTASNSYCVRDCDGYFFPVGIYSGASDTASHQRACGRLCPGARMSLYVLRSGSDKIEDAVAARGGAAYSRLMASIHRQGDSEKDKDCSCHAGQPEEQPTNSIYRDPTLRRGDAVMTAHGVEVFHGGGRFPYTKHDFRPLSRSPDVEEPTRRKLAALERASRHGGLEKRAGRALSEHRSHSQDHRRRN
jgi:hypothetical protein